jgi:GNAT superfamily N-acetyltransferase
MRGQGVGRALINAAENDFSERNITRVAVNTRFTREHAHRFYESAGYTRNGFRFVKTLSAMAD